ncbi:MAG: HEAT repeat domain-containing protein [Planctomycetes bacterium]|nr:HEAT repeat domain-containing protein [Planctomycetota bacterium]
MRSLSRFLVGLAAGMFLPCVLLAQEGGEEPAEPTPEQRAEQAIAHYEAVRNDASKKVQADKMLQWLGEVDHESVTNYLEARLEEAGVGPAALPFLKAIAGAPRPSLEGEVWAFLHHEKAGPGVRQLAAAAILSMGKRSTDRLLDMLRKGTEAGEEEVRLASVRAIVDSKDERAIRGLVPLFSQGSSDDKLRYLRLLETVHGVPEINAARIKLIMRGSLILAAVAWRQLAIEGDARARDLAIAVLERMPEGPTPDVAAEMIVGLAIVRDEDLYPLLLRYGSTPSKEVKRALRQAAPYVAEDPALLRYLAKYGLDDDRPGARDAAFTLLLQAPAETVRPLVEKVRKALRRPRKKSLDLAIGLHVLLAKDPTWKDDVMKLAASPEPEVRTVGLSLLLELGSGEAVTFAQRSLGDKVWELRAAAIRYLTRFREVSSIPLLISRFGKEDGRIAAELANALFVHTGTRCFKRAEWDDWWRKSKTGFELPHEDTVKSGIGGVAGQTSAYHGIPLTSKKVAFLVDTSGSMAARVGTDRKRTRLDVAKEELAKVLGAVPPDFMVNLIAYQTSILPMWKELNVADKTNCDNIRARLKLLRPAGGTNIYGALETAFRDPDVDTIYLLTDGEPSVGEVVNADEIADEVDRWNHMRQIVIHCIGLGIDSALLKRLAEESGGVYKFVE